MSSKPNVLFLFSDQHKSNILGSSGDEFINTPNLDSLANEGIIFEQAYCQNPLCVPSRSSLLTGQYCRSNGIYENTDILEPNSITLPRVLSSAGYRTCLIGKAHFNGEQFHGYQERPYGDLYGQAHQPDPGRIDKNDVSGLGSLVGNSGPTEIPLPMTQTEICVSEASKWLQTHVDLQKEQPFFLSVNFDKPHFPVRPPKRFYDNYKDKIKISETPDDYYQKTVPFVQKAIKHFGFKGEDGENYLASYYGCIEWVDDAVGRILDTLEYLKLKENTLVIYSSDHGDLCGDKGAWNKTLFFDSSTKVPLIIRWPDKISSGMASDMLVGLIDLFPTICDSCQISIPDICEGVSLTPLFEGKDDISRKCIFSESAFLCDPTESGCMIRQENWKYNYYLDNTEELYDLVNDPEEWNNLAQLSEYKDLVKSLKEKIIKFWKPEMQLERIKNTPKTRRGKYFYEFSNQFILGDGKVANARP